MRKKEKLGYLIGALALCMFAVLFQSSLPSGLTGLLRLAALLVGIVLMYFCFADSEKEETQEVITIEVPPMEFYRLASSALSWEQS